jgi:hypothetical protein
VGHAENLPKRSYMSIKDITVNTVSSDPFGEILSANLVIKCDHLLHVGISAWNDNDTFQLTIDKTILAVTFRCDSADDTLGEYYPDAVLPSLEAYLLPVLVQNYSGNIEALVLHAIQAEKGQYRRLGMLSFEEGETTAKFHEI